MPKPREERQAPIVSVPRVFPVFAVAERFRLPILRPYLPLVGREWHEHRPSRAWPLHGA